MPSLYRDHRHVDLSHDRLLPAHPLPRGYDQKFERPRRFDCQLNLVLSILHNLHRLRQSSNNRIANRASLQNGFCIARHILFTFLRQSLGVRHEILVNFFKIRPPLPMSFN